MTKQLKKYILEIINEQFNEKRIISSTEIAYLNNFIDIMKRIYELTKSSDLNDYNQFLIFIQKNVQAYPFLNKVKNIISDIKRKVANSKTASSNLDKNAEIIMNYQRQLDSFFDNLKNNNLSQLNSAYVIAQKINQVFSKAKIGMRYTDFGEYSKSIKDIFQMSSMANAFFSGGKISQYIDGFDKKDWENLINLKIKSGKTNLSQLKKSSDYTYYIYFINSLDKEIEDSEIERQIKFNFEDDPQYKNLDKLVNDYQHSNNKKLIPEILKEMNKFPQLIKYHEKLKKQHTELYRGIPVNVDENGVKEYSIEQIKKKEKSQQFIATSNSDYSAKNFAKSKGHLESVGRTSGYLLTYNVTNPKAVVLDFKIFGSLFYENEILINPKYAVLTNYEYIDKGYEE